MSFYGWDIDPNDYLRLVGGLSDVLHGGWTANELAEIGQRQILFIERRTEQGVDYQYKPFKRYSQQYRWRKEDSGRNGHPPDLQWTGNMLANMTATGDGGAALIYFPNAWESKKAGWHNKKGTGMTRRFLDMVDSGHEAQTLAEMAADFLADRIEKI